MYVNMSVCSVIQLRGGHVDVLIRLFPCQPALSNFGHLTGIGDIAAAAAVIFTHQKTYRLML
jgi:hypothetical protein